MILLFIYITVSLPPKLDGMFAHLSMPRLYRKMKKKTDFEVFSRHVTTHILNLGLDSILFDDPYHLTVLLS